MYLFYIGLTNNAQINSNEVNAVVVGLTFLLQDRDVSDMLSKSEHD